MQIKDIMSKDVLVVSPDTLLYEVAKKMQQRDCGSILVAKDDRLIGVITDRDLALRCVAESHHPAETNAEQVMSKEILYCRETDEIDHVALNMTKNKVRRMPVLDKDKRVVGIISLGDLAVNSSDHTVCGRALGFICSMPGQNVQDETRKVSSSAKENTNKNDSALKSPNSIVNILLISQRPADIREVKEYLWKSELTYHVEHRADFFGSMDLLNDAEKDIHIILLDLGLFVSTHSREIFRRMVDLAHGIPIVVFTDREDHDLALWAMEDGAADNITRGELGTNVSKFRDALEFSLARAEVMKDLKLQYEQDIADVTADTETEMNNLMQKGDAELVQAVSEISEALVKSRFKNEILLAELKDHRYTGAMDNQ